MARLKIDQLNEHSKESSKVIPIKQYFDEMEIDENAKEQRILIAEEVMYIIALALSMIKGDVAVGNQVLVAFYETFIMSRVAEVLVKNGIEDLALDSILAGVGITINEMLTSYIDEQKPKVYTDTELAVRVSEDSTNFIVGVNEYAVAVAAGKKWKTWKTMKDRHVRKSHQMVDDKRIPIDKFFTVGNSKMLYPMDTEHGADLKEIIACRCTCIYS